MQFLKNVSIRFFIMDNNYRNLKFESDVKLNLTKCSNSLKNVFFFLLVFLPLNLLRNIFLYPQNAKTTKKNPLKEAWDVTISHCYRFSIGFSIPVDCIVRESSIISECLMGRVEKKYKLRQLCNHSIPLGVRLTSDCKWCLW